LLFRALSVLSLSVALSAGPAVADPGAPLRQDVTLTSPPRNLQLFPRGADDSCTVTIAGDVVLPSSDSIHVELYKDGQFVRRVSTPLTYVAHFSLDPKLHAELAEYDLTVRLNEDVVEEAESLACGDVLLINGQSNAKAEDYEGLATSRSEWIRSFGTSAYYSIPCAEDTFWTLAQAETTHAHGAIGVWGMELGEQIVQNQGVPVCILNGAVGSTSIVMHQRNDSDPANTNFVYGRLLYRAIKAGVAEGARALLWHQGENDAGPGYVEYAGRFAALRDDWSEDYPSLERIYLFQIRPGCGSGYQAELREVQRTLGDTYDDVQAMATAGLGDHDGCHYGYDGYNQMAEWIYRPAARDLYASTDTVAILPPNVQAAYYSTPARDEVVVLFDQPVVWPADTLGAAMKDYFYLDGLSGSVDSGYADPAKPEQIHLILRGPSAASDITYLPGQYYNGTSRIYEGPWIRNARGVGALSFFEFIIFDSAATAVATAAETPGKVGLTSYPNPSNSSAQISFTLPREEHVRLELYTSSGRFVRTLVDGRERRGEHTVPVEMSSLPSGVFFYRLVIGGEGARTGKIVLVR